VASQPRIHTLLLFAENAITLMLFSVCSQYLENIKVVDKGIESVTDMFEDVFDNDGKTAYVFTADHGMTNWGMTKLQFLYIW